MKRFDDLESHSFDSCVKIDPPHTWVRYVIAKECGTYNYLYRYERISHIYYNYNTDDPDSPYGDHPLFGLIVDFLDGSTECNNQDTNHQSVVLSLYSQYPEGYSLPEGAFSEFTLHF